MCYIGVAYDIYGVKDLNAITEYTQVQNLGTFSMTFLKNSIAFHTLEISASDSHFQKLYYVFRSRKQKL